jgi:anaerobic ribonucleoside-triphosphate reductase
MKSFSFSKTKSPSEVNQERKTFIEDYLEKEITEKSNMKRVDHSNIYVKSNLLEYVKIVDSPGLGKEKEEYNDKKTLEIAEKASIVIYIVGEILKQGDI